MKPLANRPRGTQDVLPQDSSRWQYIERTALEIAECYGFYEMRTPTFEDTGLFKRAVGDTTDVVQKEMYSFIDNGERPITLRPEGTAGIARAAIENGLLSGQLPVKASYVINCFRYEKPQAGRLREFHQFGVESLGSSTPAADAEVIALANQVINRLGIKSVKLYINSIGCKSCRSEYHKKLKAYLYEHKDKLCDTCLNRLEKNPLRILDCKNPDCKVIAAGAPKIIEHICPECEEHFNELKERLDAMGIEYGIDPDIVRGLDYYCRTVFEFVTEAIGAQGTVCGGGRYDGLISELGGPALPGIGFAMGLERIQLVMQACNAPFPERQPCELFIAPMGQKASVAAGALVASLRAEGLSADCDTMGRSLKAQMRYADKIGAVYTIVLGDNELAGGKAQIKRMSDGDICEIALGEDFVKEFMKLSIERSLEAAADAASKL